MKSILTVLSGIFCLVLGECAYADVQHLQVRIEAFERDGTKACPPSNAAEETPRRYEIFCKAYCDIAYSCRGTANSDPCHPTGGSNACAVHLKGSADCRSQMNQENTTIGRYNGIVRECKKIFRRTDNDLEDSRRRSSQGGNSGTADLRKLIEMQDAKAVGADSVRQRDKAELLEEEREESRLRQLEIDEEAAARKRDADMLIHQARERRRLFEEKRARERAEARAAAEAQMVFMNVLSGMVSGVVSSGSGGYRSTPARTYTTPSPQPSAPRPNYNPSPPPSSRPLSGYGPCGYSVCTVR